ncbi:hypothetical protein, partial [Salmonella sp. SAL4357]|uniref:hypothetical protein n=1 Tax=Salmonella sp. SAL4357 TaxID=3159878 RepID=UPI00397C4D36
MAWRQWTAAALGLLVCVLTPTAGDDPPSPVSPAVPAVKAQAVDNYGDPLPPGAIARLGTLRFRHSTCIN